MSRHYYADVIYATTPRHAYAEERDTATPYALMSRIKFYAAAVNIYA